MCVSWHWWIVGVLLLVSRQVLALGVLTTMLRLGFARSLLIAAARMAVQLVLVGLVLKELFENASLPSQAEVLAEPIVVCRARGTCVVPIEYQRTTPS